MEILNDKKYLQTAKYKLKQLYDSWNSQAISFNEFLKKYIN